MYPYPVLGPVGLMPRVSRAPVSRTKSTPLAMAFSKACWRRMRWSLGMVTMAALGSRAAMWCAAQQMQGAVLRRAGSERMLAAGIMGSCSAATGA